MELNDGMVYLTPGDECPAGVEFPMTVDEAAQVAQKHLAESEKLRALSDVLMVEADDGWRQQHNILRLQKRAEGYNRFAEQVFAACGMMMAEIPDDPREIAE